MTLPNCFLNFKEIFGIVTVILTSVIFLSDIIVELLVNFNFKQVANVGRSSKELIPDSLTKTAYLLIMGIKMQGS